MPNGHGPKEYGEHKYSKGDGRIECKHGCGCWAGSATSGGPTGLDPFGACPKNPKDGKLLGGTADYDHVVTERIQNLSSRLYKAENRLEQVNPSKAKIVAELVCTKAELAKKNRLLDDIRRLIGPAT